MSFDGPRHSYQGRKRRRHHRLRLGRAGAWKVAGEVGRERKYGVLPPHRASAAARIDWRSCALCRDVADFRLAYPEARATAGSRSSKSLMIDSNTVRAKPSRCCARFALCRRPSGSRQRRRVLSGPATDELDATVAGRPLQRCGCPRVAGCCGSPPPGEPAQSWVTSQFSSVGRVPEWDRWRSGRQSWRRCVP